MMFFNPQNFLRKRSTNSHSQIYVKHSFYSNTPYSAHALEVSSGNDFFQFTGLPSPHNIQSSTPMMFLTCLFLYVLSEIKGEKSQCSWINETLQDTMIKCLKCTIGITSVWYETSYTIFQWSMPQHLTGRHPWLVWLFVDWLNFFNSLSD